MAVPVLVKDGKPCSGSSNTGNNHSSGHSQQNLNNISSAAATALSSGSIGAGGGTNLLSNSDTNNHSPDTPSSILPSYNTSGHQTQMLQQPCNNALMSNSLAMAYRNQNNFMSNQQQCGSYLPLQGRAW